MDRRVFVYCILFCVLSLIVQGGSLVFFGLRLDSRALETQQKLDDRISSIVKATLLKVREDVGILAPSTNQGESQGKNDKKEVKLEGARLSTFEHHFYIDNTPFFIGDIVAPYGLAVAVGRDFVVFDDLNGGQVVLGKALPYPEEKKENTASDKASVNNTMAS